MPPQPDIRILLTTFSKEEQATEVVRTLVRERLAACGTLIRGSRSIYAWQGRLEDTEEIVAIFKTTAEAADQAAARLKELHPYEVPEILILAAESADAAYTMWIKENTSHG